MESIQLSSDQQKVIYGIVSEIKKGNKEIKLAGYAGTGKTAVIKYLKEKIFKDYSVCAFTGKASNVLRKRDIPASTIHSLIYEPDVEEGGEVSFWLKDSLGCSGIIVDESSMVSNELYSDLKSFNLPIIFVGDHGQLEPIGDNFNLMSEPDFKLEKIHRNAGEIAHFAEWIRKGHPAIEFKAKKKVKFGSFKRLNLKDLVKYDQTICAFNKTRISLNTRIREYKEYNELLHVGEKVICLRNNKKIGLFNGMQGIVKKIYVENVGKVGKKRNFMDFEFDGEVFNGVLYEPLQFGKEKNEVEYNLDLPNPFDYAYVISCHRAQGDQWGKVAVIEQVCQNWDHRRWAHTASSRAENELFWLV